MVIVLAVIVLVKKINTFFLKAFIYVFALILACGMLFGAMDAINARKATDIAVNGFKNEFNNNSKNVQRNISSIRYSMAELAVKIASNREFEYGTYLEDNTLRADMRAILVDRRQAEFSKFLLTAFIVDLNKEGYVYELTGTYPADVFFNQLYVNGTYQNEYWRSAASNGSSFRICPSSEFSAVMDIKRSDVNVLPVSYKPQANSQFVIVALFDADAMAKELGFSAILSESGEVIFNNGEMPEGFETYDKNSHKKLGGNYIFRFTDEQNQNLQIFGEVRGKDVNAVSGNGFRRVFIILISAVVFAVLGGAAAARKYSSEMKMICSVLEENNGVRNHIGKKIENEEQILDSVKFLASGTSRTISDAGNGASLLDSMFLQSKMRDVYVGIDDIEEKVAVSRSFYMIYLRVNYREEFEHYIGKDLGKATFFLKQLIEMHLESIGVDATTFQIENNGIVSVFRDECPDDEVKREITSGILARLENESEYAYFTVVVSDTYKGIENIKSVYDGLIDLARYAKPTAKTQILSEKTVERGASRFYFSVEEMGKFSALLQNGSNEEVMRKVDEIFEYNIKKDINNFEMYLLSSELINCSVKLVNRVLHSIPQSLDLSEAYKKLEKAQTPQKYRVVCAEFLKKVMEQLRQNEREDDYIISYILDYVDNHYSEDIYLNLFAENLKLTGAYISSYFKEKMNVNLSDYVNSYRIKKAVELSANPQNKNKDIAVMVGLPNINTFIRLFKKYTGYTPGEYRKKNFGK